MDIDQFSVDLVETDNPSTRQADHGGTYITGLDVNVEGRVEGDRLDHDRLVEAIREALAGLGAG